MSADQEPLLDFMVVRAPESVAPTARRGHYIHDETVVFKDQGAVAFEREVLHGAASRSAIGKLVFERVCCPPGSEQDTGGEDADGDAHDSASLSDGPAESSDDPAAADSIATRTSDLLSELLGRLPQFGTCGEEGLGTSASLPVLPFEELDRRTYVRHGDHYVLLPDRPEHIPGNDPLLATLGRALAVAREERAAAKWDGPRLVRRLEQTVGVKAGGLKTLVLTAAGAYAEQYRAARRVLFDALYLLYVLRRRAAVNMEHIIDGLRVLHLFEALVIDGIYEQVRKGAAPSTGDRALLNALASSHPGLRGWDGKSPVVGFPLVGDATALASYLSASPVVHPVFAQLFRYLKPFNDVRPIGVGDLKVVRQWLTAYLPGEISHIHNVMIGERKVRDHRHLEKNEETFSFSDSRSQETQRDTQSTQRFEVKKEAEAVVKTTLGVTANANVSYNGGTVVASLGAGFSYNRSSDDTQKTAQNFAREVIDKAVDRVTTQTASARSSTLQFETEEKNQQEFDNVEGKGHVSGMYRWVDKEYTAQVYTYGKRLMFEFLVPEPAAFWSESKLQSYEAELDVPQPPEEPVYVKAAEPDVKDVLNREEFLRLGKLYDLTGLEFPEPRTATLVDRESGKARLEETGLSTNDMWYSKTYAARLDGGKDHVISAIRLSGKTEYTGVDEPNDADRNLFALTANGTLLKDFEFSNVLSKIFWPAEEFTVPNGPQLDSDDVMFTIGGQEITNWWLTIDVELEPGPRRLATLRAQIVDRIRTAENARTDAVNRKLELAYETALAEYREQIDELKALTAREVLQGGSSAANRLVMDEELKKHCLTLISKEFDSDTSDDVLHRKDAMKIRKTDIDRTRFDVKENKKLAPPTLAGFKHEPVKDVHIPAIDIDVARDRGLTVQFLEQAFEWHHISYLFYPYFWAELPRWVELMNQSDDADHDFTAFLRAGMARVLVAVTPAYEDAVLHYLATREPWTGGPAPVIGDPLFLPLHEELRKQTDDRLGGEPDGEPWTFTVPTTLVYLHDSQNALPDVTAERKAREKAKQNGAATEKDVQSVAAAEKDVQP